MASVQAPPPTDTTLPAVIPTNDLDSALVEKVMTQGDLGQLSAKERNAYYLYVCRTYGMNPLTRPMEYVTFQGKKLLYVKKEGADQLRLRFRVSVEIVSREVQRGAYVVVAKASTPDGRVDCGIGSVWVGDPEEFRQELPSLQEARENARKSNPKVDPAKLVPSKWEPLTGESFANAVMKAETKAKRRATMSIVGLGWLDDSQIEGLPGAQTVTVGEDETFLTEDQQDTLRRAVTKAGMNEEKFLKAWGAESYADLSVSEYKAAMKNLTVRPASVTSKK